MSEEKLIASRDVYGKTLAELGKVYPDLVVLDADLSQSTKTCVFGKEFPDRFFNMGVAEQNLIGVAAGLAASGKIAFASTFAVFASGRAWDQIRASVAYPHLNVKIVATHGGITTGEDGATHQALEDIAIMRVMPNMTVIVPADAVETRLAIHQLVKMDGPAYVRLNRLAVPVIHENENCDFEIGRAQTLHAGSDLTIIACGIMVKAALDAAKILKASGILARVINLHTIKPLDVKCILLAAQETGALVTAEEHSIIGGLGAAVAEVVCENCPVPVVRVGMKDIFGESGKPAALLEKYGMTAADIVTAAKTALKRKSK
ncbi:MAG: transketolase family protein [Candidatus Margulisiibacteriota bacterium]